MYVKDKFATCYLPEPPLIPLLLSLVLASHGGVVSLNSLLLVISSHIGLAELVILNFLFYLEFTICLGIITSYARPWGLGEGFGPHCL